jgi:hypothetical protein
VLGRALTTELQMGRSLRDSLVSARDALPDDAAMSRESLENASGLIRLGQGSSAALDAAVQRAVSGRGEGQAALRHVVSALGSVGSSRTPAHAVARVAAGVEADRANADALGALFSEPRFVAVAIPVVGMVLAFLLATVEPTALTALNNALGVWVLAGCVAALACGVAAVRRLTREW